MNDAASEARRRRAQEALTSASGESVWALWRADTASVGEAFDRFYREVMIWARVDPATALAVSTKLQTRWLRAVDPSQQGRALRLHAHVLRANARLKEAAREYQRATVVFEQQGELVEAGRTCIGWIDVLSLLGEHHAALKLARRAEGRLARADGATRARLQSNIGTVHHHLGQYDLAIAAYRKARRALRDAGHDTDLALVDFNYGQSLLRLGRVREARRWFTQSLAEFEQRGFTAQALRARFGVACATLYLGDWDEGSQQLHAIRERVVALGDLQAEAAIRWELSLLLGAFGAIDDAEAEARVAHAAYQQLGIARDAAHLALLHARWLIAQRNFSDAQVQLASAREHFVGVRDRDSVLRIDIDRAAVAFERGQVAEAEAILRRVRTRVARLDSETALRHQVLLARMDLAAHRVARSMTRVEQALRQARRYPMRLQRPAILLVGARTLASLDRTQEAVRWARRAAREMDRLAERTGEDHLQRSLRAMRDRVVREAIELVLDQGHPHAARDALDLLSRAHSRELIEDLLQQMPRLAPELRSRIAMLREQLLHADQDHPGDVRSRVLSRDIDQLDRALRQRLQRNFGVVRRASEETRATAWRSRVPRDAAVVVFDQDVHGIAAFVVEQGSVRHVVLTQAEHALRDSWRPLQLLFEAASSMMPARREEFLRRTLHEATTAIGELGRALWEPLGLVSERVHVVLPGSLHGLPMEAIGQFAMGSDGPVISRWPHPSLIRTGVAPANGPAVLVHDGARGTRSEVGIVAKSLRTAGIEVLLDSGRSALRNAARVSVFHVAGHGSVTHGHWVGTGIQLADGWLGLEDVAGETRFRDALLYFASCGSGQHSPLSQGRFDGWAAAGLSGGAREIVAALWKIDDASAKVFSEGFYRRWSPLKDAPRAARDTRTQLRAAGSHPYQWAPFTVVG